ncbi:hypothetical protein [Streptomyces sp. MI02-7b]
MLQAQRDHFGAYTYRRTDRRGSYQTRWDIDRIEQISE